MFHAMLAYHSESVVSGSASAKDNSSITIKLNERGPVAYEGVTLIMACRNRTRAEAAWTKLLPWSED